MIFKKLEDWYVSKKVTEITTIVGNRKYGKSYSAGKMQEIYVKNKWPFGVIDNMGIHYALRNICDNVIIIGGEHADYEIKDIDKILEKILDQDYSFILDLSDADELYVQEFVGDLFQYLFDWHKIHKKPRNYFIEECDTYIGQNGAIKQTKDAIVKCVTKGRSYGFGFTFLSQRFRMIDKTPLSQTDNYFIFNMKLPLDLTTLKKLIGEDLGVKIKHLQPGRCVIMTDEGHDTYNIGTKQAPSVSMTPEIGVEIKEIKIKELNEKIAATL